MTTTPRGSGFRSRASQSLCLFHVYLFQNPSLMEYICKFVIKKCFDVNKQARLDKLERRRLCPAGLSFAPGFYMFTVVILW